MNSTTETVNLHLLKAFKHATVFQVPTQTNVLVVEAMASYIPIEQFKEIFAFIGTLVASKKITKLIFDKRKLTVFHQPSMEWYFVDWKEKMFPLGLKIHRKILPEDRMFKESVKIGREKINKTHPNAKFHLMDIQYFPSLEACIAN